MKLALYEDSSVFDALRDEWDALLQHSTSDLIFCTWEWQSTWWETYEAGHLWVITCRDDAGRLIAIAPWFIEHNPEERVLRTIGCVDVTDYVDIIADVDHIDVIHDALASFVTEHHSAFDRVNLCNIPEASPTTTSFLKKLQDCGFEAEIVLQEVCPVIELPETFEEYLSTLDKKQRHELRRKQRRAEAEAEIEWYVVGPEHDLHEEMERFLELMAASHPEKAAFLENPRNLAFFRNFMPVTFERGWLKLSFLKIDGKAAASYCDFDYGNRILVYNSGLLPDWHGHLSAGIVLLTRNIRDAIESKRAIFDFLRGDETYKYRMGAKDTRVFKLRARMPLAA